jgi:hypothetical protein
MQKKLNRIWWVRPETASERYEVLAMKYLNQFLKFGWEPFAKNKRFMVVGSSDWTDYQTKEKLGTRVECIITKDDTSYNSKDGSSNMYEKITFKVPMETEIPVNAEVKPKNVEATVYGEFRNQLSCVAQDIEVVSK